MASTSQTVSVSKAIVVVTPLNVRAGAKVNLASTNAATPVMIYGATDGLGGGSLYLQSGALTGTIQFFGGGGLFQDQTGVAGAYKFYGGGGTIKLSATGSTADIANTGTDWTSLYGAGTKINLKSANANVIGAGNTVAFSSGANQVSLYGSSASQWDTVNGSNGVAMVSAISASIVGGGNTIYAAAGVWLSLYATNSAADVVRASSAYVILNNAQAELIGGGDVVYASAGSTLTVTGTTGAWNGVYATNATINLKGAQATIVGGGNAINATQGSWTSLYLTSGHADTVTATGANIMVNSAQAYINGGGNEIYGYGGTTLTLGGTGDNWDRLHGSGLDLTFTNAQVMVFGNGNSIQATNSNMVFFGGQSNAILGSHEVIGLSSASASLRGDYDSIYFAGQSALTATGNHEDFHFNAQLGSSVITGFNLSDRLYLPAGDWASYDALVASHSLTQVGANAVIRFDAHNSVTLAGVQASTLTAAQFAFA